MLLPPDHIDLDRLRGEIDTYYARYDTAGAPFAFVPLGEDSWAFRHGSLWVSLRRDLRGHVPGAYEAARLLRESGLRFVLAPLAGVDGRVVRGDPDCPVVIFPYTELAQLSPETVTAGDAAVIVEMLARVHKAWIPAHLPRESFAIDFDTDLAAAMDFAAGLAPTSGYPARLHRLLRRHRRLLANLRAELAELGRVCAAADDSFVLTHGEPSAANILRGAEGLMLADWGGAMWGPAERDWFHVSRTLGIEVPPCRKPVLDFYRIRWRLSEIAEYASRFRKPCANDAEDAAMWGRLLRYLPER